MDSGLKPYSLDFSNPDLKVGVNENKESRALALASVLYKSILYRCLFILILLTGSLRSVAQQTELYATLHCGGPFSSKKNPADFGFWNYGLGIERFMAGKISIAFTYKNMFAFSSLFSEGQPERTGSQAFSYEYTTKFSAHSFDFESKYFFDDPEEGGYISSGITMQLTYLTTTVTDVGSSYYNPDPDLHVGTYTEETIRTYPISIKLGNRFSNGTFTWDVFLGCAYNAGVGNNTFKYDSWFEYDPLKRMTFLYGFNGGVMF